MLTLKCRGEELSTELVFIVGLPDCLLQLKLQTGEG